jgi:ribosomal protein S18 acetylase RimI-like enzyme
MATEQLDNRGEIEAFLRRNAELHVYSLGDLDDVQWPSTTWYGRQESGQLRDVVLIYTGSAVPTVVGISEHPEAMRTLLEDVAPLLPKRFHAHLSPGVEEALHGSHAVKARGPHYKMSLRGRGRVEAIDCTQAVALTQRNIDDLLQLYQRSYPGNWFDETMLDAGPYFGLHMDGRLVSIAGVHVYSPSYRVAALGNITTDPAFRSRGYGTLVTARLCQALLDSTDHIGLNVKTDNAAALACYSRLGFEVVAPYGEFSVEAMI